ncbi:tail fiber protein [Escherichia coli]|nr:tail fiber protein [Escherichia coli]
MPWPSATPPTGWLKCNGAAFFSRKVPKSRQRFTQR